MSLRLSNKDKLNLMYNLATMLSAGIPILDAVSDLKDESAGNQKKVFTQLEADITQGGTISDSFAKFDRAFDSITINLIKSAEESGNLDSALKDITKNIKKTIEFNGKIKAALTYPVLVLVLFLGIMLVILTYVIPRIADVFSRLKVTLPLPTKILIATSEFFLSHIPHVVIGTAVLIGSLVALFITKRRELANAMFSLPLLSRLAREIDIARFSSSLGLLLESGIPIANALEFCEQVVLRKKVSRAITLAKDSVVNGKNLSEGFKATKNIFPVRMIRITEAGEKSGSLEKSMHDLAEQSESQVDGTLKTVTTMLEPLMLVFIGLLVGGIMLSIIAPIYQLIGSISPR
jgi:type IV pilus assembly protein PilC